ncbi:MAG: hypothetical protein JWM99_4165 [Verrucomicrobiales bacterium]|nr:hypothetical protein [Verrucomicrobiales bacterium]
MKHDNLRQYVSLRDAILQEKTQIEQRLREINQALGQMAGFTADGRVGPRSGGTRNRNAISLRDAVIEVVKSGSLSKDDILKGVQDLGYKFATNDPMNSLGVILYGKNPKFLNEGGRFGLPSGFVPSEPRQRGRPALATKGPASGGASGRRQMSPEAKAKIAAAAKTRWANWRAGKK